MSTFKKLITNTIIATLLLGVVSPVMAKTVARTINPIVMYDTGREDVAILLEEWEDGFYSSINNGTDYEKNVASYLVQEAGEYKILMKDNLGNEYRETVVVKGEPTVDETRPVTLKLVDATYGLVMETREVQVRIDEYTLIDIPKIEGMESNDNYRITKLKRDSKKPVITYYYKRA